MTEHSYRAVRMCDTGCVQDDKKAASSHGNRRERPPLGPDACSVRLRVPVVSCLFLCHDVNGTRVVPPPTSGPQDRAHLVPVLETHFKACDATRKCHGFTRSKENHFEQALCHALCLCFKLRHNLHSMKVPFKRAVQWWRLAHSQRYRPHPARSPRPTRGRPAPPPRPPRLWTVFTPLFPYLRTGGGGWASSFLLPERWRASSSS